MHNAELYISLLEKVLVDLNRLDQGEYRPLTWGKLSWRQRCFLPLDKLLSRKDYRICKYIRPDIEKRRVGADWPYHADTMIGLKRLQNIKECVLKTISDGVKGDLIETGVWRGGATIFMRALLKAYNVTDKKVWVADSFEGLPKPNVRKYAHDRGDAHHQQEILRVSLDDVRKNFAKYDLLDEQVQFLKGWFRDTLPTAPIDALSVLRLDGDMYESTMDALVYLYPKLSPGGYVIVDDWGAVRACRQAVEDFRSQHKIKCEIMPVDWAAVYWKKS